MPPRNTICYVLTDAATGRAVWHKPSGFRAVGPDLDLSQVPYWTDYNEAVAEAKRIRATYCVLAKPLAIRIP